MNVIKLSFLIGTFTLGGLSLLLNLFETYLPLFIPKLIRHGKFSTTAKVKILDKLQVPKRCFKHYYMLASGLSTLMFLLVMHRYVFRQKVPDNVIQLLTSFLNRPLYSLVPAENTLLAISIFTLHCWKRLYESFFINVFSDTYVNLSLYLIAIFHYIGTTFSIIGESEDLATNTNIDLDWSRLGLIDFLGTAVFLGSTYMQYRTNVILSNLRKDKKGNIVTLKHKVPHGELFEFISSPLQLTEIFLYMSLSLILRKASTFHYVTIWVTINQVECAYLSHQWAIKTFEDYPKFRKVIVPYVW